MSTENKNTDNMSQTLFRFVSLRSPQLTDTKHRNVGFIFRPKGVKGIFDKEILNYKEMPKILALEKIVQNLTNFEPLTGKNLEEGEFADLLKLGIKISKNAQILDADLQTAENYYLSIIDTQKQLKDTGITQLNLLWDNLIYQTVTQKDFYAKEALIQELKAIHIGFAQTLEQDEDFLTTNGQDYLPKALNAKVVFPPVLFSDDYIENDDSGTPIIVKSPTVFTVAESALSTAYIAIDPTASQISDSTKRRLETYAEKNTTLSLAVSENSRLEALNAEIEMINKNYHKDYSNAYTTAQKQYQASIQPILDQYEASLQAVRDTFTANQTPEEQEALLGAVPEPNIPEFKFEYPVLDTIYLKDNLSEEGYLVLADVLHKEFIGEYTSEMVEQNQEQIMAQSATRIEQTEDSEMIKAEFLSDTRTLPIIEAISLDRLNSFIDVQKKTYTNTIQNTTAVAKEEYASVGGFFVPVKAVAKNPLTATLSPKTNFRFFKTVYDFDLALEMPDSSWEIESMDCFVKKTDGTSLKYTPKVFAKDGVKILVQNIFNDQFSLSQLNSITEFAAKIYFKNDKDAEVSFILANPKTATAFAKIVVLEDQNSGSSTETTSTNSTASETKKPFVPKGFGIRRLGIADYLKVEQSLHAYVPGEVSNIENVMAREYRQKSTRKLSKSDITNTSYSSVEKEHSNDTAIAKRNEMQSEIAKMKMNASDISVNAFYKGDKWGVSSDFAHHRSREESTRQAVTKSQEVTAKVLDRIISKVSEERVSKIIEEFEENNMHGFDNRAGDKHVVGVYRWVDKIMKNQIYDYGKRLMFEFMIPQPAKLHENAINSNMKKYTPPIDPRKSGDQWQIGNEKEYTFEKFKYWADKYGSTLEELPANSITQSYRAEGTPNSEGSGRFFDEDFEIPENYKGIKANIECYLAKQRHKSGFFEGNYTMSAELSVSNLKGGFFPTISTKSGNITKKEKSLDLSLVNKFNYQVFGKNINNFSVKIDLDCTLSEDFYKNWYENNLVSIISKYNEAFDAYQKLVEEEKANTEKKKEANPLLYREIEQNILKHNAIAYMVDPDVFGRQSYTGNTMKEFAILRDKNLDDYASLVKFMEQAFEWEEMSYNFYPYYWGSKEDWPSLYQSSSDDAQFRSFLQSGMARVVATVKPGFEDAVTFYMSTGKIWNGGEIPVIGDPMYLSIVDEMKETLGEKYGKYWLTRIPTSLTILQAESIGLQVNSALPYFPEDNPKDCENPEMLVTELSFKNQPDALLGNVISVNGQVTPP